MEYLKEIFCSLTAFSSKQSDESLGAAQITVDTDSTRASSQYLFQFQHAKKHKSFFLIA